jgi:iron(III) transport system substrate-binding protein
MNITRRSSRRFAAAMIAGATFVVACGDDDPSTEADPTTAQTTAAPAETSAATSPPADTTAATESPSDSAATTAAETTEPAGERDELCGFDQALVDAAQEEGEVIYFGPSSEEIGADVAARFEEAYGISVTYTRMVTADLIQAIDASVEAGAVSADTVSLADPSGFISWTEDGTIVPLDIPNADELVEGLRDPERHSVPMSYSVIGFMYNEERIDAADVPQSWAELQSELGDRVIAFSDPAVSGAALTTQAVLADLMGEDYISGFADAETLTSDSSLTLNQFLLTGEADFGVPGQEHEVLRARSAGEPLAIVYPEEGLPSAGFEVAALANSPHPNAGQLMAQWFLCDDYQNAIGLNGIRPSISTAALPDGAADLTGKQLITADAKTLVETRQQVIDRFVAATG